MKIIIRNNHEVSEQTIREQIQERRWNKFVRILLISRNEIDSLRLHMYSVAGPGLSKKSVNFMIFGKGSCSSYPWSNYIKKGEQIHHQIFHFIFFFLKSIHLMVYQVFYKIQKCVVREKTLHLHLETSNRNPNEQTE